MLSSQRTTRHDVLPNPGQIEGVVVASTRQAARPLVDVLKGEGMNVQVVGSPDVAFEEVLLHRPNLIMIDARTKADVARAVEEAIVETLTVKAERALEQSGFDTLVVSGGVSANLPLRAALANAAARHGARVYYPRIEFCTDNAAMIAVAGLYRLRAGERQGLAIEARAQWPLESLAPVGAEAHS